MARAIGVVGVALAPRAHAGVVLNEIFADATSVDASCDGVTGTSDDEFVEIVNVGPGTVDLSGATLSDAGGVQHTFAAGTVLDVNEAVVVFAGGTPTFDGTSASADPWCVALPATVQVVTATGLSLNNTGDTVTLADSGGAVLDTHTYGAEANADLPLVRDPELTGGAWIVGAAVTPGTLAGGGPFGAPPPDTGGDTAVPARPTVVLNEIMAAVTGGDAGFEWIELLNVGADPVDLNGFTIRRATSGAPVTRFTFPSHVLLPGDRVVVGDPYVAFADLALPYGLALDLPNATTSADVIQLVAPGEVVVDTVVYGAPNTDALVDDSGGIATSLAPTPVDDLALARIPDGQDTDASGADFVIAAASPGAANATGGTDTGGDTGGPVAPSRVVINEIVAAVSGTDDGYEWVELLNLGPDPVELDGWTIERGTSGSPTVRYTFPAYLMSAGERLVVGEQYVAAADFTLPGTTLNLGNATSSADVVRLVDGLGTVVDTVVYGSPNTDGYADDSGAVATSLAPTPVDDQALARIPDGQDTDASGADFVVAAPSPGAANVGAVPVDTAPDTGPTPPTGAGLVVVNEFLPGPAGTDTGYEWVEILNLGPDPVELGGWTIQRAKSGTPGVRFTFPTYTMAPGERLVVGESYVAGASFTSVGTLDLGNATSDADVVLLVDPFGTVSDTVVYGPYNTEGFVDDSGAVASSLAPEPVDGMTLSRIPDGQDTDASGADFLVTSPTMGAVNLAPVVDTGDTAVPPTQTPSPFAGAVVVNELVPDVSGTDAGYEWLELLNVSGAPVDLEGWAIQRATSSWSTRHTFVGTAIPAGGRLLVGDVYVANADVVVPGNLDLGNATSSGDGLRLVDASGLAVDTVIYGPDNSDGLVDDHGTVATSVVAAPGSDLSLARVPDGVDTDDSAADFLAIGTPTPGQPNLDPADACSDGAEADGVVVNEFDTTTTGAEWVEVFNGASAVVDLSGWALVYGTSSFSSRVPIPDGTTLEPGAFLVIGALPDADVPDELGMGNASSSSDGLRLEDCVGGVVDTVVYGQPNTDALVDDSGAVATSLAPTPASGATIARGEDGRDTDQSAVDFVVQPEATPGASNPEVVPIVCVPSSGDVVINEIFPDPEGSDDGTTEWVELYNGGSSDASVAGWVISAGTSDFEDDTVIVPGGTVVPAGGWLVVGGDSVDEADVVFNFQLGNGTDGDGVRLFDCEGAVVDTVLYGDSAEDQLPDDDGEVVEPYGAPDSEESLARIEDGVDTNAAEDWDERGTPTPGASNVQEGSGGGITDPGGGCGCGGKKGDAPSGEAPSNGAPSGEAPGQGGGCATVPLPLRGFEFLIALVAVRRRRR